MEMPFDKTLTNEDIEKYIWENISIPLDQSDIDKNTENYETYLMCVQWAKWGRDNANGLYMPTIILTYTLFLRSEKRIGIVKLRHCKTLLDAQERLKQALKLKHPDFINVEF